MAKKKRIWPWVLAAFMVAGLAASVALYRFLFVPYEPGRWHQVWTVTVTDGPRTETSSGFGDGRCGDEGANGASSAKKDALERACAAAQLCPGDAVCDCAARAQVRAECEAGQNPGRTHLGDLFIVPIH